MEGVSLLRPPGRIPALLSEPWCFSFCAFKMGMLKCPLKDQLQVDFYESLR